MASMADLLRFSPLSTHRHTHSHTHTHTHTPLSPHSSSSSVSFPFASSDSRPLSLSLLPKPPRETLCLAFSGGGGTGYGGSGNSSGGGGGDWGQSHSEEGGDEFKGLGPLGLFMSGWRSRVAADPQFPFKVLMEEIVGVTACVAGDMASRPNFGLNELDFVFSTLVVGSILNFTLMYLLAPTMASSAASGLPWIFANCPASHMFESGSYGLASRLGTLVYKGAVFAAVGFAAGLVGTALSNGLIAARKKMDPEFETPNKAPPTLLNAMTWAIHMGASSNLRYQTLNGVEFVLERALPGLAFKSSVVVLRCLNNVLGGMSFVVLARMTGSQSVDTDKKKDKDAAAEEEEKLVAAAAAAAAEESEAALQGNGGNQSTSSYNK